LRRSKNTVNILIKNWLDMCIGALVYWAVGFGLSFGKSSPGISGFMGTSYFFFYDMPSEDIHMFCQGSMI
jgi:Amt family ammonium transporter